jgi:hypothetical protein
MVGAGLLYNTLDQYLRTLFGIAPSSRFTTLEDGGVFLAVTLFLLTAFMLGGYVGGWLFNALFTRFFQGRPLAEVEAIYLNSQVPARWLKGGVLRVDGGPDWTASWAGLQRFGALHFILVRGGLVLGTFVFSLLHVALPFWKSEPLGSLQSLGAKWLIWVAVSVVLFSLHWRNVQRKARQLEASGIAEDDPRTRGTHPRSGG